jgi:hypothetical protein
MIYLECDNDEAVVRALGIPRREIEHEPGKSLVAKALQASRDNKAIGLVDEDPGAAPPPYLKEFVLINDEPRLKLRRLQHPTSGKWLVEIRPDLEPWIYAAAEEVGLAPADFNLPPKPSQLHTQPKNYTKRLMAFIQAMEKSGCKRIAKLAEWLR